MIPATASLPHDAADLTALFNAAFARENTLLLPHADAWRETWRGEPAAEPLYLPAGVDCPHHRIVFAHGFFASALHEVAHWCLAGRERRAQIDYGYWYAPDDRDAATQAEFERVEAKPQAIEWAFSAAARFPFRVSVDNLSGIPIDRAAFEHKVRSERQRFEAHGFPPRAQRFLDALAGFRAADVRLAHG